MARKFEIPGFYRSTLVSALKRARRADDSRKKDLAPSIIDLGPVVFKLARHFGFCFGVENAIEIAYRALSENSARRVFLLSEMIHNPHVNADLQARGVRFIMTPDGEQIIPFEDLRPHDVVIIPAFGTTVQMFQKLRELGIEPLQYNTTCPFVEKVWKRAEQLGKRGYSIIIHGKHSHEETRATFSHAALYGAALVVRDIEEATLLADFVAGRRPLEEFSSAFDGRVSAGFDCSLHLSRLGVVNQTTMLATETQRISEILREAMRERFGSEQLAEHFADTRDTLCYATYENQEAIHALASSGGDVALVVGGYNSSNTSHLVEILERHVRTYYIKDSEEILSSALIRHLDLHTRATKVSSDWLPIGNARIEVLVSAGASCPDSVVDQVLYRVAELCGCGDALEHFSRTALGSSPSHFAISP